MRLLLAAVLALFALHFSVYGLEPFPLERMHERPEFSLPKVSPDGIKIAILQERDKKQYLLEIDLATMRPAPLVHFDNGAVLANYWWKSNSSLLTLVQNTDGSRDFRVVDLQAKKEEFLLKIRRGRCQLVHIFPADPDNILLSVEAVDGFDLCRLDLRTGKLTIIEKNPGYVGRWIVNSRGEPVAAVGTQDRRDFLLWRTSSMDGWQRRDLGPTRHPDLVIASIHSDQQRLLAWDYTPAGPATVVAIDPATMGKELLLSAEDVDPDDVVDVDESLWNQPRGVVYETDRPRQVCFGEEMRRLQASVDAALPDTVNEIVSASNDEMVMVVRAGSDRERGTFFLLDRRAKRLALLGARYRDCSAKLFCPSQYIKLTSRDGLSLHGRLTLPVGSAGKPPLVIVTAPYLLGPRSRYQFNLSSQLFATRGYAVLQLDHRGTYGYGQTFLKAGDYQITRGMPDDIDDAIKWLIAHDLIDGSRVAIFGRLKGGLVAMHALARYPDFAVWINSNTPAYAGGLSYTDLAMSPHEEKDVLTDLGGERLAARDLEALVSRQLVEKIQVPSFHYYDRGWNGTSLAWDGDAMERYVSRMRAPHEFLAGEQHNGRDRDKEKDAAEKDEIKTFGAMFAFLDKYLMHRSDLKK